MNLPTSSELFHHLRLEGRRARKRLGQHFLFDEAVLMRIAESTRADPDSLVVEIGPGPGALTSALARTGARVLAVERDRNFAPYHARVFCDADRIEFLYADALAVDLWELARSKSVESGLSRRILAGNLPFQITSPLLFGQLGGDQPWERMVLMVQREVADRIVATPGNRTYGILTVKLAYWWRTTGRIEIPAGSFRPRPKVDAATLVFEPSDPSVRPSFDLWPGLSKFIDGAFNQRRKKLYNSLIERWKEAPDRERIKTALESLGINPDARAESLAPGQFLELYRILTGKVNQANDGDGAREGRL
jgi:16S rRNA (adenine1518-N6/adenine1519-N6)-dimethyltransferase